MTFDHAGYVFFDQLSDPVRCIFFLCGGITFLTMAYLLTEGYRYTHDVRKYALRLFVFALVSQIPFQLFLAHELNVMFTLLIGLGILYADDHMENRIAFAGIFAGGLVLSILCDWGVLGPFAVLLFKRWKNRPYGRWLPCFIIALINAASMVAVLSQPQNYDAAMAAVALPQLFYSAGNALTGWLLHCYNGARGRSMKWFFYVYYPAHILVLGCAYLVVFGQMPPVLL